MFSLNKHFTRVTPSIRTNVRLSLTDYGDVTSPRVERRRHTNRPTADVMGANIQRTACFTAMDTKRNDRDTKNGLGTQKFV